MLTIIKTLYEWNYEKFAFGQINNASCIDSDSQLFRQFTNDFKQRKIFIT